VRIDVANLPEDRRNPSGGGHATQMADSTSVATNGGCGAAVGSSLPTSPGVDPAGGAQRSSARSARTKPRGDD
jgi:hypothetical protein